LDRGKTKNNRHNLTEPQIDHAIQKEMTRLSVGGGRQRHYRGGGMGEGVNRVRLRTTGAVKVRRVTNRKSDGSQKRGTKIIHHIMSFRAWMKWTSQRPKRILQAQTCRTVKKGKQKRKREEVGSRVGNQSKEEKIGGEVCPPLTGKSPIHSEEKEDDGGFIK